MALQRQAFTLAPQRQAEVPASAPARIAELWLAVCLPSLTARSDLESLAAWADRITPLVDLSTSDSLLLEVRGSLKLLGGLDAIKHMLEGELRSRGVPFHACAAPTARGALWLARHGASGDVTETGQLSRCLGALPVSVTRWPEHVLALLEEIGAGSIAACRRLPRDGFARRVGPEYLLELDQALGRRADPRAGFRAPPRLRERIELSSETDDFERLGRVVERLAERMARALRFYQRQAQRFGLVIAHRDRAPTRDHVGMLEPVYQKRRLLEPLLARLEQLDLPAPAIAMELYADELEPIAPGTGQLFERGIGSRSCAEAEAELVERLRGRLGATGVYGLELVAEHRPEWCWSKSIGRRPRESARSTAVSPWALTRPLWLLSMPITLAEGLGRLRYRSLAHVEPDPERIVSGWWDGGEVRRDYYTALTEQGERLWIYRDGMTGEWYLHGIFG